MQIQKTTTKSSLPPWMQAERVSFGERFEIFLYRFVSIFPVFVTFGLFSYLGVFFVGVSFILTLILQFYLYPLLAGNFDTFIGVPNMWKNSTERNFQFLKGVVLLALFIFLSILDFASIIQTIRTPPGAIPEKKEWDMQSDSSAVESSDDENKSESEIKEEK